MQYRGYTFFAGSRIYQEGRHHSEWLYHCSKTYDLPKPEVHSLCRPKHLPEEIIAAMVEQSRFRLPYRISFPKGYTGAVCSQTAYDFCPQLGMDKTTTICAIAREQAMPASILSAAVTAGRRMRPKPTAPLM